MQDSAGNARAGDGERNEAGYASVAHPGSPPSSRDAFRPPSLRARHVSLRPLTPGDYPYLQMLESSTDLAFRWRLRGSTRSPEQWAQTLWGQVLAQFVVVGRAHDTPVGLVSVYRPNFQDGHAYFSAIRFDTGKASPLMGLGTAAFLQYVFTCWDFRKLYAEFPEFNLPLFESALRRGYCQIEGRLREHVYFGRRYWDLLTVAVYRDVWDAISSTQELRSVIG
jgi:RimJ/RimL family protein N-acetyltransferase